METTPSDAIATLGSPTERDIFGRSHTFAIAPSDPSIADSSSRFAELDDGQLWETAGVETRELAARRR